MTNNILIIAAHSDDQTIGPGGTAAKYAKEGFDVRTVIFSKGEISYPHFQEKIIVGTREKEALRADKIIGGKGVKFLGVLEKDFNKEVEIYKAKTQLERVIKKLRPTKIFTHSPDDPHPAHRKISTLTLEIVDSLPWQLEVYGFDIWSPFKFKKKTFPTLVVDITDTFDTCFKSF
jgi:LmbE family N-acetylglucosaminyl deacetylase